MDPAIALSASGLQRFFREARAAAELRSPHVVQVLDHGVDEGTPYIVMEMLEGESLASRLERVGKLAPLETASVVVQVARALSRAQRAGVTHRDLKPDNVFLIQNEDEELAKVLDFGIAKVHEGFDQSFSEESTAAGVFLGTPYYVSPEQAEGLKTVDHRTDIWSLGVMTFECLLGQRPFQADTLPALLLAICSAPLPTPSSSGEVPSGFDAWFWKACARDVDLRFGSAKEAAFELSRVCEALGAGEPAATATLEAERVEQSSPTDAEGDDGAPTEIWRGGSLERLAYGQDPNVASKSGFATTAKGEAGTTQRWFRVVALGLLALTSAGLAWSLASGRDFAAQESAMSAAALPGVPSVHTAPSESARAAKFAAAGVPQSAASSLEHVRTIDLSQLPLATKPPQTNRGLPPHSAPKPEPSANARPSTPSFLDTPPGTLPSEAKRPLDDTSDSVRNPYR